MRSACVNGYQDGVLQHVLRVLLAAALGSLPIGGCTEKPNNQVLQHDASAGPETLRQSAADSDSTPQPALPPARRSRPKFVARVASQKFVRKPARPGPN